jgi:hypothetical protein
MYVLPHNIITYGQIASPTVSEPMAEEHITVLSAATMASRSPFATLQHTVMKELPKFTGEGDQKVTQSIDAVEHIGSVTERHPLTLLSSSLFVSESFLDG